MREASGPVSLEKQEILDMITRYWRVREIQLMATLFFFENGARKLVAWPFRFTPGTVQMDVSASPHTQTRCTTFILNVLSSTFNGSTRSSTRVTSSPRSSV